MDYLTITLIVIIIMLLLIIITNITCVCKSGYSNINTSQFNKLIPYTVPDHYEISTN